MVRVRLFFAISAVATFGCASTVENVSNASPVHHRTDVPTSVSPTVVGTPTGDRAASTAPLSSAGTLDRAAFVQAVLRQNPSVESARQAWRAASAHVRTAGVFDDPMVDLGVAPLSIGSSRAPLGYEVGISQKLPWFGKRSLEASVATAEAEALRNDFEGVQRGLALTAVDLYDRYFVSVRSLEINAAHVELLRAMRASAEAAFESGRGSAQDPLQAESELAHMERDTAVLASERDVVVAQINDLLHRGPDEPVPPPPAQLTLSDDPDAQDWTRLEAAAVVGRRDIAAARLRARAEQARADRAQRESYPDVTVSTSYNSMWDTPEHRWMVGFGINLPIQSGPRTAATDEALAMRAAFESEAKRLESSARTAAYVALKELEQSRRVLRVFEERLFPTARMQIDAARAGFTASRNPFMAVVEAERNLRTTELDYQVARAECDRRHAELEHALGRIPGLEGKADTDVR